MLLFCFYATCLRFFIRQRCRAYAVDIMLRYDIFCFDIIMLLPAYAAGLLCFHCLRHTGRATAHTIFRHYTLRRCLLMIADYADATRAMLTLMPAILFSIFF